MKLADNYISNSHCPYDAMGRMASAVVEGVSTNLYLYSAYGELTNEVQNGVTIARNNDAFGRPSGYTLCDSVPLCEVNYSYDAFGRPIGYALGSGGAGGSPAEPDASVAYSYDSMGRFASVSAGLGNVPRPLSAFAYSYLPGTDLVSGYTSGDFARSVSYEPHRDLIASVTNAFGSTLISAFDYANDAVGRRVSRIDTFDGAMTTNVFGYNVRTEVTSAVMGTNSYGYAYDPVGNRITSSHNGETTTYTANNLNQYSAITYPLSSPPSHLSYDSDGNMTADGSGWHYTWNGENRMVCASNDEVVVTYAYDHRGRMVKKGIVRSNGDSQSIAYLWDNWNIICETLITSISTNVTCNVWGLDLDGSLQGAGGVGGLLAVIRDEETFLMTYEANGNVCEYVTASSGVIVAHYGYSPFGEPLIVFGELTSTFTHQFSTKPSCGVTCFNEYPYRKCKASIGRWISRDPLGERGGKNVFLYCLNNPLMLYDAYALTPMPPTMPPPIVPPNCTARYVIDREICFCTDPVTRSAYGRTCNWKCPAGMYPGTASVGHWVISCNPPKPDIPPTPLPNIPLPSPPNTLPIISPLPPSPPPISLPKPQPTNALPSELQTMCCSDNGKDSLRNLVLSAGSGLPKIGSLVGVVNSLAFGCPAANRACQSWADDPTSWDKCLTCCNAVLSALPNNVLTHHFCINMCKPLYDILF